MSSFQRYGDWDVTLSMAQHLHDDVTDANKVVLKNIALMAESIAVKHIRNQDLRWAPLSPRYAAWKKKNRRSYKIYISTSDFMQSVTSQVNSFGTQSVAGVFKKSRNRDGQVIADIGKMLEWGSIKKGIPARPLWRPTYEEVRRYLMANPEFANEVLKRVLARTGGKGKVG